MNTIISNVGFRPLAGFWFLNCSRGVLAQSVRGRFRPLAGFWFLNIVVADVIADCRAGFRPLAGFWFLNRRLTRLKQEKPFLVSVPLRGSGS